MEPYSELSKEDQESLTKEITALLEKYGAEMGVKASIQIYKQANGNPTDTTKEESNATPEESSEGSSEKPTE